jgi:hypothetical protein
MVMPTGGDPVRPTGAPVPYALVRFEIDLGLAGPLFTAFSLEKPNSK